MIENLDFPFMLSTLASGNYRCINANIVMAREIFGPDYLPYRQEKQM